MVHFEDKCGSNLIIPQKKKTISHDLEIEQCLLLQFPESLIKEITISAQAGVRHFLWNTYAFTL